MAMDVTPRPEPYGDAVRSRSLPQVWREGAGMKLRVVGTDLHILNMRTRMPFRYGIDLGVLQPELEGREPREFLPDEPLRSIAVRHTVGLTDPLTDAEVPPDERVDDGLPQSLEACVRYYGLSYFKIKLWGDAEK